MRRLVACVASAQRLAIEVLWVDSAPAGSPVLVFLHEGLGSLSMWRDFPQQLCTAAGARGLVYSRPGYGASSPRLPADSWGLDFMHRQAWEVLPALLAQLEVDPAAQPLFLFGHSDGASIALLHAVRFSAHLRGAILLAPHILVEERSLEGVAKAREAYMDGALRERLARHHADPDAVFWGWNRTWLDPAFRDWSIEDEIAAIRCPLLAVQGVEDAYGTLEQVRGIARRVARTQVLELPGCGHMPHREQTQRVIEAGVAFIGAALTPG